MSGRRFAMADQIRKIDYYTLQVPNQPGEAARVLRVVKDAGVNLIAFTGFPSGGGAQVDFIPEDGAAFEAAVQGANLAVSPRKQCFWILGEDRPGAVADALGTLGEAKINVVAIDAVCAGNGRYGAVLWVQPRDFEKAARVLGAS
jgi:hypothetical protein